MIVNVDRYIRTACYVRVSTEFDDQDESFRIQQQHFRTYQEAHPECILVGIFAERCSGTHVENRPQLALLLDECRAGNVDLVLTKSISRMARNTVNLLEIVRSLKGFGVGVIFEREDIDTRTMESEVFLSLLASFAEAEVRSISENNRWAIRKRFENGTYKYPCGPYGYDVIEGRLHVNTEEANTVRHIFREYLAGKGCTTIADELNRMCVPTRQSQVRQTGKQVSGLWDPSAVNSILHNEVYAGDSLLQKKYTDHDFSVRRNRGECTMYLLRGHHEPLIERDTFEKTKVLLEQRARDLSIGRHAFDYAFSGKCHCGRCGAALRRRAVHCTIGDRVFWDCGRHAEHPAACSFSSVPENSIRNAFVTMLNKLKFCPLILELYLEGRKQVGFHQSDSDDIVYLGTFLEKWDGYAFPEALFREVIEQVDVFGRNEFRFTFTCGLTLTERSGEDLALAERTEEIVS